MSRSTSDIHGDLQADDSKNDADFGVVVLERADFDRFRELIRERTGIALGDDKRSLIQNRLSKRLRALGMASFREYHDALRADPEGAEMVRFSDVVTTNKTSFYREPHHFEFMANTWLPELMQRANHGGRRRIRVWSAACSSGEEPYTIACTILDTLGSHAMGWDVRILATDLSTKVLDAARSGMYTLDKAQTIPTEVLKRHFLRGTGSNEGIVRVRSTTRDLITFAQLNFIAPTWPIRAKFDLVFCRNALIYFDRPTQQKIVRRLADHIEPGGYLILGHSECVHGWFADLHPIGSTVYRVGQGAT